MNDGEQMSSSIFTGRWTSVNDLTRPSHAEKPLGSFYLQSQAISTPSTSSDLSIASTIRPSKSLLSLVEAPSVAAPAPAAPPVPPRTFRPRALPIEESKVPSEVRLPSSRVASIIHRFESGDNSSMNNRNHPMASPPTRIHLKEHSRSPTHQSENGSAHLPRSLADTRPSTCIPCDSKQIPKASPIIIYERIVDDDRSQKIQPVEIPSRIETQGVQARPNVETTTNRMNTSPTLSHSTSSDLTTTGSCSPPIPVPLPVETVHSGEKQRDSLSQRNSLCRSCSPPLTPSASIVRSISSTPSEFTVNLERGPPSSTLTNRFCSSEMNLVDQYRRLMSSEGVRSETNLCQNSSKVMSMINTDLPLKYKRESLLRLHG